MTHRVGFLLLPGFPLLSFSSALEPLRLANRQAGSELYAWQLLSTDGGPVINPGGIEIRPHGGLDLAERLDLLVVAASDGAERLDDRRVLGTLQRFGRRRPVAGLTFGTWVLARAGLLDGRRCTLHWEHLDAFRERFPSLEVTAELFEIDGDRLTCSGGTAALDMMLHYIGMRDGWELATEVSDLFIHERIRDPRDHQRMPLTTRLGIRHPGLLRVVELMEANVEEPLSRRELAVRAGLSGRQLERLFRRHLECTPRRYYLGLRLQRARHLLSQTPLAVMEVALACGFTTASHFAKTYREHFGRTPSDERRHPAAQAADRGGEEKGPGRLAPPGPVSSSNGAG